MGKKPEHFVTVPVFQRDNCGFTLIEVMVAILILMVGMLGLLQAINLATEVNIRNQVRDEAVYIGERVINEMRSKGFDNISVASPVTALYTYGTYQLPSKLRGASRSYSITRKSRVLSTVDGKDVTKELTVNVAWSYKGVGYQNQVVVPISILR